MKPRILAIDDEEEWLGNFRAWVPDKVALQDSADTTTKAIEFLRRCRYHAVILDLSMDVGDRENRENHAIQEHLATRPDGTTYIIVSGTIQMSEVRDSAFHLNAFHVFFKDEIEPSAMRDRIIAAIGQASARDKDLVVEARSRLTAKGSMEDKILRTLHPSGGAQGMYLMLDAVCQRLAPLALHRDRPHFEIWKDSVVGLVWSRQLGMAVSILLTNRKTGENEANNQFTEWLGYAQQQRPIFARDISDVRVQLFAEAAVSDAHFDLPMPIFTA